ncbi:MAG: carbohydrate binding family 9 domain-containing protein [Candidatus Latescibacteria bacterium]|nr:carbohydrate binding family 9 domain-containing protein [Candidatus Latescibacterota bacterium]
MRLTRFMTAQQNIIISLIFLSVMVCNNPAHGQNIREEAPKKIQAYAIDTPIRLDGKLTEPVWSSAESVSDFTQRELVEGDPATEKTEVKILYDRHNLYIGVMCYDSEPEKIIHTELRRDGELDHDDNFTVVLDTFNDKRSGFFFRINPNGAWLDGKITGGNGEVNENWNGVWEVSTKIHDQGWCAEMLIPFKTLRFTNNGIQNWGINFRREIARKKEEMLWSSWKRDDGIMQLTKAGTLTGLTDVQRGKQIEFKPFALGGLEHENSELDRTFKYGFDVKYPVTSDLTLDLTTLTDFAQVESDQNMINLTRFSLHYPEKRDFFLEGAETFDFGSPYTTPYYSRRIGIAPDGEQVPILGGAKLTGKAGSYNLGILNMQTDDKAGQPSSNYSVIRVKKDILKQSYVGIIATNLYDTDKHKNQAFGADFSYSTNTFLSNKNLVVGGYVAENNITGVEHGTRAGRFLASYPNDLLGINLLYHAVGDNYDPETGYVRRNGIKQYSGSVNYTPRPGIPYIRKLWISPINFNYYTDMHNRLLTRTVRYTPFGFNTMSEWEFRFNMEETYEFLDEDFEIFEDKDGHVIIPQGSYTWWSYSTSIESNPSNPVVFDVNYVWGDFFNGQRDAVELECDFKINQHFTFSSDIQYNSIKSGSREFDTKEFGGRINVNISPRLTSRTFLQWNNESKEMNMNLLIHFIPKIGNDVYLVYNQLLDSERDYKTIYSTGIAKISYLISF